MSRRFSEESVRLRSELEADVRSDLEIERGRRRLLQSLERKKPKKLWLLVPVIAAILLLFFLRPSQPIEREDLVIVSGAECVQRSARTLSATCEAELWIGRDTEDLSFSKGRARFSVAKREQKRFEIAVSHGVIVVLGTRFVVEQRDDGGRIDVEEGTVEFRWTDGSRDRLGGGASLEWPRPLVETASVTPPRPEKKVAPKPQPKRMSSRELMQRLFQLKSQRRYDEAIDLLADGSRRKDFSEAQRERLSYELGVVLRQSGRSDEACRHFSSHLRRFPSTPRKKEIADTCP